MTSIAQPYEPPCRACDSGLERKGILGFKRTANLCPRHQVIYQEELEKDLKRTARGQAQLGDNE